MLVRVTAPCQGTRFSETKPELYDSKQVAMSNGVTDIQKNVLFDMRVEQDLEVEMQEGEAPTDERRAGPRSSENIPKVGFLFNYCPRKKANRSRMSSLTISKKV